MESNTDTLQTRSPFLLLGVVFMTAVVAAVTVASLYIIQISNRAALRRASTAELLLLMASLENDLADQQTGILGFVSSHQARYLTHYNAARTRFESNLVTARFTEGADQEDFDTLDKIRNSNLRWQSEFAIPLIRGEGDKDPKVLQKILQAGARTMNSTRNEINEFLVGEHDELIRANREDAQLQLANHGITLGGGFLAVAVCLVMLFLTRRIEAGARLLSLEVVERKRVAEKLEEAVVEAEQATEYAVVAREELAQYSRTLEVQVAARTAELTEANGHLMESNAQLQHETAEKDLALKKLQDTQSFLLQSEKLASLGQLAAGVAHEINNPIGFINSNLHTLSDYWKGMESLLRVYGELERACDGKSPEGVQLIRQLQETKQAVELEFVLKDTPVLLSDSLEGASRVVSIVQNLKEFAHVDAAQRKLADLNTGIESTLKLIWNELKYKVRVEKDLGALKQIECHPQQLNQVFLNLFVNAAQAIEKDGVLKIATAMEGNWVLVTVTDNGGGIRPEHLSHIFDPFFTTKPVGKGTGLGLSVVYSIVKNHGGTIEVESEVGRGTTFRVRLPTNMPETAVA